MSRFTGRKLKRRNCTIPTIPLDRCIAKTAKDKPGMSVLEHCLIVGHTCKCLLEKIPRRTRQYDQKMVRQIALTAALHDIGKVSPGFQRRIYSHICAHMPEEIKKLGALPYEEYHAKTSNVSFQHKYPDGCQNYGYLLGAHHGQNTAPAYDSATCDYYGGPAWEEMRQLLIQTLEEEFGKFDTSLKINETEWEQIAALIVISDWIGSDEHWFGAGGGNDIQKRAHRAIEEAGWTNFQTRSNVNFKDIFKYEPYNTQGTLYDVVDQPGVYILESSTGRGKTEAALNAAYKMIHQGYADGIYFAMPTRITSDRIYDRIIPFMEKTLIDGTMPHLIHGQSWLKDQPTIHAKTNLHPAGRWFMPNKRSLLADFGVGTIDQALMAVLKKKHNFLRSYGLYRKVVILDEVHTYDTYTSTLLEELVRKLRSLDCTVIILSATLSYERKVQLLNCPDLTNSKSFPLITALKKEEKKAITRRCEKEPDKKVKLCLVGKKNVQSKTESHLISTAIRRALKGEHVLWIVNKVQRSVDIHKKICATLQRRNLSVGIVHSRYPQWQRDKIELEWTTRLGKDNDHRKKCGSILVSTQIMEQSVDVDADVLITDLCPMDFLIQRIGRLWRHPKNHQGAHKKSAPVYVQIPHMPLPITSIRQCKRYFGPLCIVYSPYVVYRTLQALSKESTLHLPQDTRRLIRCTYKDITTKDPIWMHDLHTECEGNRIAHKNLAEASTGGHMLPTDEDDDEDVYQYTRYIEIPTTTLLLLQDINETTDTASMTFLSGEFIKTDKRKSKYDARDVKAAREMSRNIVKVPGDIKDAESPEWLQLICFGRPIPVIVSSAGTLKTLNGQSTGYCYCPIRGVHKP